MRQDGRRSQDLRPTRARRRLGAAVLALGAAGCGGEAKLPPVVLGGHFEAVPIPVQVDLDLTNAGPTYIRQFAATATEPEGFFLTGRVSFACHLVGDQIACEPTTSWTVLLDDLDGDGHRDTLAANGLSMSITWGPPGALPGATTDVPVPPGGSPVYAVHRGKELLIGSGGGMDLCSSNVPSLSLFRLDGRSLVAEKFDQPRPVRVSTNFAWGELLGREMVVTSGSGCMDESGTPILFGRSADGGFEPVYLDEMPFSRGQPIPGVPMGVTLGDFNSDGRSDLIITNDPAYQLYFATAEAQLSPTEHPDDLYAPQTGQDDQLLGWGAVALDLDGDGHDDFCVANGFDLARRTGQFGNDAPQWPSCFVQVEAEGKWGRFVDVTKQVGLEAFPGQWYGLEQVDLNHDGHPDLLVGAQGAQPMVLVWKPSG